MRSSDDSCACSDGLPLQECCGQCGYTQLNLDRYFDDLKDPAVVGRVTREAHAEIEAARVRRLRRLASAAHGND